MLFLCLWNAKPHNKFEQKKQILFKLVAKCFIAIMLTNKTKRIEIDKYTKNQMPWFIRAENSCQLQIYLPKITCAIN
jgi:hypothetical protein